MRFSKAIVIVCFILTALITTLSAQTTGFIGIQGLYDITEEMASIGLRGNLDYRTLISPDWYVHAALSGEGKTDTNFTSTSDRLLMQLDSTWFLSDDELRAAVTTEASIGGNEESAPNISPDWDLTYRKFFDYRSVNPYVTYRGFSTTEQIMNGLEIGFSYAPKVELSYTIGISGGFDTYLASGDSDLLASLDLKLSHLIGFAGNLTAYGSFTYRASEEDTREGLSGTLRAEFSYTPTRKLQIHAAPAWYWEYLTLLNQWNFSGEFALRTDIEITQWLYGYLSSSVSVSPDALWDFQVTIGTDIAWGSW
jgi:hypothetical protein